MAERRHRTQTHDLGFLAEQEAARAARKQPLWDAVRAGELKLDPLYEAAEAVGGTGAAAPLKNLTSPVAGARYWAAVAFAKRPSVSAPAMQQLRAALVDPSSAVRIAAAQAVARHGRIDAALPVLTTELQAEDLTTVMYAARAIELLGEQAASAVDAMRAARDRARKVRPADTPATVVQPGDVDLAMFIGFSTDAFLAAVAPPVEAEQAADGQAAWIELFDGRTLEGWSARAKAEVEVADGEIQLLSKGANLWLVHEATWQDFELQVEALMPADDYNSGIGFRCTGQGKPKGYQCEIDRGKSGMIYAIGSGWVWPVGKEQSQQFKEMSQGAFRSGEWNRFRIRCEGQRLQIWINDRPTADVRDARHSGGSVALQHHGKGGLHRFRNIRLRPLPAPRGGRSPSAGS